MKRMTGFTLIELLVTISLVGILTTMAVPGFKTTIQNGRLVSQGNDLLGAMIMARSQAIASNTRIMLCSSSNLTGCANSSSWESGWIIGTANAAGTDITGTPIRVHDALTGSNTLRNDAAAKFLIFTGGSGIPTAGAAINFRLCDSRGTTYARSIYLSAVGEGRISPTPGKKIDGSTSISSCP
jgi:type IV fimbrial biogenesis protein FimT